ncbi:MAG: hypothetical protein LUB56_00820 [Coprobacillus sp.]|nr:hypothetical protein [Coprobacillus sp.]
MDEILEPLDEYNSLYKGKVNDASGVYFDELVEESEVDLEAHRTNVKNYEKAKKDYEAADKKSSNMKGVRIFLIVCAVAFGITFLAGLIVLLTDSYDNIAGAIVSISVGITLMVGSILLITLVVNQRARRHNANAAKHKKNLDELYKKCVDDVNRVLALFDWNIPVKIIRENVPLIQLDDYFDMKKYDYLYSKYGLGNNKSKDSSTVFVLSGTIVGNPFLLVRNFNTEMSMHTYTGTRIISYPVRVSDGHGHYHTVMQHQTIVGTVTKPAPTYGYETYLVYASDAAPNLTFSRKKTADKLGSEKEIEKFVKSETKELNKKATKATRKGQSFTAMTNSEFEALFHAWDRNNEVEFRLLYTPLAQQNTVKLLKSTTPNNPYGDDFRFVKKHCLNYIYSDHDDRLDVYMRPDRWRGYYSLDTLKKDFVTYVNEYFKAIYFDLAPLISIPLYQQHKPIEYIYKEDYGANLPPMEDEAFINGMPNKSFQHPESKTDAILKASGVSKKGNTDKVKVDAYSYKTVPRIEVVMVLGGDMKMHHVDVPYLEYVPLKQTSYVSITNTNGNKKDFDSKRFEFDKASKGSLSNSAHYSYSRGFLTLLRALDSNSESDLDNALDTFFGYNNKEKNSSESQSDSGK